MYKSKSLSLLIFSTEDIGSNIRLLSHAKSFSEQSNSKVLILAPDITSLPKQIEKTKNIRRQYFHQYFSQLPSILLTILYPLKLFFYTIELFIIAITYPSFDFCLVSYGESFFLSFCLSKWCHAKLIFDYPYLKWSKKDYKIGFLRRIEEKILSFADYHICSTQAIHLVLRIRNINAFVIHDQNRLLLTEYYNSNLSDNKHDKIRAKMKNGGEINSINEENIKDSGYFGNKYQSNDFISNKKAEIFQILNINYNSEIEKPFLCGIPIPQFNEVIISKLLAIGDKLNQHQVAVCFVLFASHKIEKNVEKEIEKHTFSSTQFKVVSLHSDAYPFILSCCDFAILFYPTLFGLEYSNELLDMILFELPIVAYKHGSVTEAVKEGKNGFLFNNEAELAKILNSILIEKSVKLADLRSFYCSSDFDQKWNVEWARCFHHILFE